MSAPSPISWILWIILILVLVVVVIIVLKFLIGVLFLAPIAENTIIPVIVSPLS